MWFCEEEPKVDKGTQPSLYADDFKQIPAE